MPSNVGGIIVESMVHVINAKEPLKWTDLARPGRVGDKYSCVFHVIVLWLGAD